MSNPLQAKIIFALLPLFCCILLSIAVYNHIDHRFFGSSSKRRSLLVSAAILATLTILFTEVLSLFRAINFASISIYWSVLSLVLIYLALIRGSIKYPVLSTIKGFLTSSMRFQAISIFLIAAATLIIALCTPPNTWDSMTYHLSRCWHWEANKTLAHFETGNPRQLFLNPGAEMLILHLNILSEGDRLANLLQWLAMAGSLIGISLIAELLGAKKNAQIFSAVFMATLPMGILQSSSTQTDYLVTFWIISFVYFGFFLCRQPNLVVAVVTGISLGLAILTKASAYLVCLPFALWIAFSLLRTFKTKAPYYGLLIMILITAINFGHYYRNYNYYHHPIAPENYRNQNINQKRSVPAVVSNIIRNSALHLGTPSQAINSYMVSLIKDIHKLLGIGLNDPDTTFLNTRFSITFSNNEDTSGNPLHFLLAVLSIALILLRKRNQNPGLKRYCILILGGVLLFCFYIRWNPWNSRYQLPFFALLAPAIGALLPPHSRRLQNGMALLLLFASVPWVVYNYTKPLISYHPTIGGRTPVLSLFVPGKNIFSIPRWEQYFVQNRSLAQPYWLATDSLVSTECRNIGTIIGPDDWEYPFLALMEMKTTEKLSISRYKESEKPCAVFTTNYSYTKEKMVNAGYHTIWNLNDIAVFTPAKDK